MADSFAVDTVSNPFDQSNSNSIDPSNGLPLPDLHPAEQARASMSLAIGSNPDYEAELRNIAAQTGVPVDSARADTEYVKQRAAMGSIDFGQMARDFPNTAKFLGVVSNAQVAHDDVQALTGTEGALSKLNGPYLQQGPAPSYKERAIDWVRNLFGMAPAADQRDEGAAARAFIADTARRDGSTVQDYRNAVGGMSELPNQFAQGFMSSASAGLAPDRTGDATTGGGEVARGLGDLAGFLAGAPMAAGKFIVGKAFGSALDVAEGSSILKAAGQDILHQAATMGAASAIGATGQALNTNNATDLLKAYGKAGLSGAEMGATFGAAGRLLPDNTLLQTFGRGMGVNALMDAQSGTTPWDNRSIEKKVFDYGLNTLFSFRGAGRPGGSWLQDAAKADIATQDGQALQQLNDMAGASKLRTRDPAAFQDFIKQATEDGPVQDVYVDPQTFHETLAQSGVSPEEVAAKVPSIGEQLAEASITGQDLRIPVDEFATHMAGEDYAQGLIPHLKTDPNGMSQAEAQEFMQSHAERLQQDVEQVLSEKQGDDAFNQSAETVKGKILDQLNQTNRFKPDVHDAYATMMSNFYKVQAARLGETPEALYEQYPVNIRAEHLAGNTLNQNDTFDQFKKDLQAEYPDAKIDLFGSRGNINLSRIVVPEGTRSQGIGSAIMRKIVDHADATGRTVTLSPSGDFGGKVSRLKEFYKRFGFVENKGKNKDFTISESMYRTPKSDTLNQSATPDFSKFGDFRVEKGKLYKADKEVGQLHFDVVHGDGATPHIAVRDLQIHDKGQGTGTLALSSLMGHASQYDLPLAIGTDKGLDPERLKSWYQAMGFFRNEGKEQVKGAQGEYVWKPNAFSQETGPIRGSFNPDTRTISLLKNADLSTFLHESGHFFLEVLHDVAGQEDAPQAIKDDLAALHKWFGVKDKAAWDAMTLDEKRPFHEQFARGFEQYLFEGKAPSVALQGLFQRFRAWLLHIYKSFSALNVELSPEVRGVFDRMLATSEQIKEAEAARSFSPMFASAEEAGMTPDEWRSYQDIGNQATQDAVSQLEARSLRDMQWLSNAKARVLRGLQKEAAEKRKAIRREVEDEVNAMPIYAARRFIQRGELDLKDPNQKQRRLAEDANFKGTKLSLDALKQMYGEEGNALWRNLPTGEYGLVGREGMHPDDVAELFGFPSGDAMVRQLLEAEPRKSVIEGMTDQRMLERHGDLTDPQAMDRAADEAIHNEARTRFIATEMNALNKATGQRRLLAKAAKEFAQNMISRLRIRDVKPGEYTAAEARAGRNADEARRKGDLETAAAEKRNQLIHNYAAKAAMDAQAEIEKGLSYLKKFDRKAVREGLTNDYLDQIDALLERFDLRKGVSLRALDRRQSLLEWAQDQQDQGYEPAVSQDLLDEANRQHYKDMSVETFRGLVDTVKSIEHLGRLKQRLLDLKDQREFDAVVDEAVNNISQLPQKERPEPRNPGAGGKGLDKVNAKWLNVKSTVRSADASILKMEQMLDWLDGHDSNGVLNRIVFRRLAEAGGKENDLLKDLTAKMRELGERMPKTAQRDLLNRYEIPELIDSRTGKPSQMLKSEIIAMALNTGNDSNLNKMAAGEKWNPADIAQVLNRHMTKDDWDFVQGVWDTIEHLWPEIEAMERRLGNTAPEKVIPRPVQTPFGEYRGGYYPMIYDPLRSFDVDQRDARAGDKMFENTYTRATTRQGHVQLRNEDYARPLLLSMDVIPRHLTQVVHDLAYREAIIDADRFLSDNRIRSAIEGVLGREYYAQLRPWLQSIANDRNVDSRGLAFWDKAAHWARTSATLVGLGFRLSTMMIHGTTALSNSIGEIGPRWMASGTKAFFGSPAKMAEARDFIFERSAEMRNRMNEVDRDVRDALRDMALHGQTGPMGAATTALDAVKRTAYYGISMLDMGSALPTWMGAYNKALHEGMSEEDAIYAADKAVRNAHGGGGAKDLAAIQRGNEFQKLFTMFYSFWNHFYNRQRDIARTAASIPGTIGEGDYKKAAGDFGMVLARSFFYFVIPQLIHAALKPPSKNQDDHQHWATWAAEEIGLGIFSGIPVVRDVANAMFSGRDYAPTPAAGIVTTAGKSLKDLAATIKGDPASDRWLQHAIAASGYVFGLPTGQAATSAQFLWDVSNGKEDPQGLSDWLKGIAHGHVKH